MILLNFFARALAFHVLLVPVITLFGAMVLLILVKLKKAPAALRAGISGATLMVVLILPWAAMTVPKVTIPVFSATPDAQTESLDRHLPPAGVSLPPPVLSQPPVAPLESASPSEQSQADSTIKISPHRLTWRVLLKAIIVALVCAWILGALWGFCVLTLGMVGIIRLRWSSHLVTDTRLTEALRSSCERMNYRRSVLFLISEQVPLPITWGWLRAKIALPEDALNWPAERIDAALLHELAHIKRRDFAIQTLSRFACVFHWYNPIILRLFRVWKIDAEQACDDLVLQSGYSGERYSDILLEVWRSATVPRPQSSLGLAMVRSSTLEQRVVAILDPERAREEVSPRKQKQLVALFGGITLLIAVVSLTRPTNYHLTPELQNDMQAILQQVQNQESAHLSLQLQLERRQEYWSNAKGAFSPQSQATEADITLELNGTKTRYRAKYHPLVSLWVQGSAPYYIDNRTDVSDGSQTETILSQHRLGYESRTKWRTNGDIGLLAGFGYRADDQVRTVINELKGNGFTPFSGASYGIERTVLNGAPAVRVQDIFTTVLDAQRRTWWFDPQRDYALIQYELADFNGSSTEPTYSELTSIQQLQKMTDGVWYPTQFSTQSFRYVDGHLTDDSFRSSTKITSLVALPSINPATFLTTSVAADLTASPAAAKADASTTGTSTVTATLEPPPGIQFEKIAIQDQNPFGSSRLWKLSADSHSFQSHLPPGNYNFRIIGQTPSGQLYFSEPRFLKVEDSAPCQVKLDTFTPAFRVTGSVDASVPRPIKNGMVLACVTTGFTHPRTGWFTWNSTVEIRPDGTFDIPNLPSPTGLPQSTDSSAAPLVGQLELIATCDGYISKDPVTKRMEYAVGPQVFDPPVPQPLTLTMEPLGSARVRVLDPQGNPLAGAIVRFSPNESFRWISTLLGSPMDDEKTLFMGQNGDPTWQQLQERYQAASDQDGEAVVKGLPPGFEPYIVLNTPYDVPYRLRLDQSSTKYAQNGIVVTEPGSEVSAEMRLIPKIAPIVIPNATSPDGKYVVSVEPSQGLPMNVSEPQSVVVRDAKTGKYVNSTFLPSNSDRQVELVGPSDVVKAQWNSTSSFFIFSVLHKDRLDFTVVAFNSKDLGMATSDIGVSYGHDLKVVSLELTGERTFKAKIQQKNGNTFYSYATVNNIGQVTMGSEPDAPSPSTQNSQSQGKVLNAKGETVANAKISLVPAGRLMTITDGQMDSGIESILSASDGGFTLNQPGLTGDLLVAVSEDGYAVIPWEKFNGTVTLTSWAKVSGTAIAGSTPLTGKSVIVLMSIPPNPRSQTEGQVRLQSNATVDSQGSFVVDHAPEGVVDSILSNNPKLGVDCLIETAHIETQANQIATVAFGGKGITVTGKAEMPNDPDLDLNWDQMYWVPSPVGLNIPSGTPQAQADKMFRDYYASDAGIKALLAARVHYFHIQPDGSFKIENVPPGSYRLRIDFMTNHGPGKGARPVGNTSAQFEVKAGDTSVELPLLKLHLLPKQPNSTTSNDVRNPALPASLQMEGAKLTIDQIAALQQKVLSDPSDLEDRVRILGYYFLKRISESSAQNAAQPHLLWIIRNFPASAIAGDPITSVDYRTDLPHYEEAREAWTVALAKYPNDPKVIANAAAFFLLNDSERAEKLLLQGQKLEPSNPDWAMRLGHLYSLRSMGPDKSVKVASTAQALQFYEQGLASLKGDARFYALEETAKAAFVAGDFTKAHDYAQELLQTAPQYRGDWNYGNALYTGNSVLGQIALAQGDIPTAKNYLGVAGDSPGSPQLDTFGPDMTLARQLLEKGEKDAVIAFLGKIGKFWKGHEEKIQDWQKAIQQGQTTF